MWSLIDWFLQRQLGRAPRLPGRHTERLPSLLSISACPHAPQSQREAVRELQIGHRCAVQNPTSSMLPIGFYRITLSCLVLSTSLAPFFSVSYTGDKLVLLRRINLCCLWPPAV